MEGESETRFSTDPSSTFLFYFALKLEGGIDTSSVSAVPPSSGNTSLLIYIHPAPSSGFFSFEMEGGTDAFTVAEVPPSSEFCYRLHSNSKEGLILLVLL